MTQVDATRPWKAPTLHTRMSCVAADRVDELAPFREEFDLPAGLIYLDGNSLGPRPRAAEAMALDVVNREWGHDLIASWNSNAWFDLPTVLGDKVGRLIGARSGEVVVSDSTSVNIFKALAASIALQARDHPDRRVIVVEKDSFPTDGYIAEGLTKLASRGYRLRVVAGPEALAEALDVDVVSVLLSHVDYRTGAMYDLDGTTRTIHDSGALAVWDLAHSAGAVPVDLNAAGADFAVGCTYKYLNGGPGAPAFIWVPQRHQAHAEQPLSGWWGHVRPFAMEPTYAPAAGIRRYLCGTQPVVSLALVEAGLDIALKADMAAVRRKSLALSDLFIHLVETRLGDHPLVLATPGEHARRGSHVSFTHPQAYQVIQALISRGVVGDYREPSLLRFGLTPLYLGYADVWDTVDAMQDVLDNELWRDVRGERLTVT